MQPPLLYDQPAYSFHAPQSVHNYSFCDSQRIPQIQIPLIPTAQMLIAQIQMQTMHSHSGLNSDEYGKHTPDKWQQP
eukprot:1774993-Ditylum_brightwellii.AAC.1